MAHKSVFGFKSLLLQYKRDEKVNLSSVSNCFQVVHLVSIWLMLCVMGEDGTREKIPIHVAS